MKEILLWIFYIFLRITLYPVYFCSCVKIRSLIIILSLLFRCLVIRLLFYTHPIIQRNWNSRWAFRSRGSSPNVSNAHRGYSCGSCDVVAPTRPALRKHIVDCHPPVPSAETGETKSCPSSGCDFTTNSRCEMETHVAAHVAQGMTPTGKKRTLALQRVRYRYLALASITVLVLISRCSSYCSK